MRKLKLSALCLLAAGLLIGFATWSATASEMRGCYLESRTCQVYTGPCFANAEINLTGKDAIMAWKIDEGTHTGVDLSGLAVVVVLNASDTFASGGIRDAKEVKSIILVDNRATAEQRDALVDFAKQQTGRAGEAVVRIDSAPIEMSLDVGTLTGTLSAGKNVKLTTRKARPGDCICSNEIAYYPPLAQVTNFAPGVSIESEFSGRGLGTQWSMPNSRSAYMGVFEF